MRALYVGSEAMGLDSGSQLVNQTRPGSSVISLQKPSGDRYGDIRGCVPTMASKVTAGSAVACYTSVPALDGKSIVAFLEDRENDCSKVSIPIAGDPPSLDIENLEVEDGLVRVFPVVSD